MLKDKQLAYKHKPIKEMENFEKSNPKEYWDNLTKLRKVGNDVNIDSNSITPEESEIHFKELAKESRKDDNNFSTMLNNLEQHKYDNDKTKLDYPFTIREIKSVIRESKNGKTPSDDLMLYEMFKTCINVISPAMTKLFNIVLNSESFPDLWNIAYQVPIFKGGDVFDVNNFRGISITSCLGKLFNRALNKRLQDEIELSDSLKDTQAAYRKDFSTTDQIYILNSLLNKYVKFGKKETVCVFCRF